MPNWPLSQDSNKANGRCSVCLEIHQLHHKDGFVHLHGPRNNRCPGSNQPPLPSIARRASLPLAQPSVAQPVANQHLPEATLSNIEAGEHPVLNGPIIKHVPKSARHHCASQLTATLNCITNKPTDLKAWSRLFNFGNTMLLAPPRGGKKHNLTSLLKGRLATDDYAASARPTTKRRPTKSDLAAVAATVTAKIDDGNIKAALRILSSDDKPADCSETTINALKARHPPADVDRQPSPLPGDYPTLQVTETLVTSVIKSFPAGSAGGPDGVRPQHLLDFTNNKEAGPALTAAITTFVNMLLSGVCPPSVIPIFFGGSLIALEKKSGGIRPIAIGYTLRRIAAKCANNYAITALGNKLLPLQLGLGTSGGCEAAVHATRRFISVLPADYVIAKLDFSNAFNNLHRDVMLSAVASSVPEIYRFCHLAYDCSTHLKFSSHVIPSQEGAQQGDPLGPLLFCLSVHPLLLECKSQLKLAYIDDITLGGPANIVSEDVAMIKLVGAPKGLLLNDAKCEAITTTGQSTDVLLQQFIQLSPFSATLLGAPLVAGPAMDACLNTHCNDLERAISRLELISAHDALVLLRASFSAPSVLHTLRSSPCSGHQALTKFDSLLRTALSRICNVSLSDSQWLQASLPVKSGGLGIRRVASLATSAFLASAVGTHDLQNQILVFKPQLPDDIVTDLTRNWQDTTEKPLPDSSSARKQQSWDKPVVEREYAELLLQQPDNYDKARLLAAASKHSADWLHAIPITSCGLRLEDNAVRIAVGLRLGTDICQPHTCQCGALVDVRGSHGLSCKRSAGRLIRHNHMNDIIHRSLTRAGIPATREPNGLSRTDGKRPDGLTLIPWREGRCLIWDVTIADTTAASYLPLTAALAGSAAESAATRKEAKYIDLSARYDFVPVAIESHGPLGSKAAEFLSALGRRITANTLDMRESSYLFQRLSIALQRFNAVCISDTFCIRDREAD